MAYSEMVSVVSCQKAPSAIRCIKTQTVLNLLDDAVGRGQKAPSAIRCIKTLAQVLPVIGGILVRKHLAP